MTELVDTKYIKEFEEIGEQQVRQRLTDGTYKKDWLAAGEAWLESRTDFRSRKQNRETIDLARNANRAAGWAVIFSVLAIIVALLAWAFPQSPAP